MKKTFQYLSNEKGASESISFPILTVWFLMIVLFCLSIIGIFSLKGKFDALADQTVKQIQLTGAVSPDTDELFNFMAADIPLAKDIAYEVETDYIDYGDDSKREIQLGTPIMLTVTAKITVGGLGKAMLFEIPVSSRAAGVSEVYWK